MNKKSLSNKKNSYSNEPNMKKGIEFHSNKIMPQLEKKNLRFITRENEWDQEYFIIYNSYILEDKEQES
jgi:hypothetical protein